MRLHPQVKPKMLRKGGGTGNFERSRRPFGFSSVKLKGEPVSAVLTAPPCLVFVLLTLAALTCCFFFGGGNPLVGGQDAKC